MKPIDPHHAWLRLAAAARTVPDDRDPIAPYGFSTRVAALAFSHIRSVSLIERFALRAVGVACLLALASVAINYPALKTTVVADDEMVADDVVAALLEE